MGEMIELFITHGREGVNKKQEKYQESEWEGMGEMIELFITHGRERVNKKQEKYQQSE